MTDAFRPVKGFSGVGYRPGVASGRFFDCWQQHKFMETMHLLGTIIYFTMIVGLSAYGCHRYVMIYLYYKYRKQTPKPAGRFDVLPKITVQLPLFNEMYVADRLLDSITALDYPQDKLEIQVLDDSTDET